MGAGVLRKMAHIQFGVTTMTIISIITVSVAIITVVITIIAVIVAIIIPTHLGL